MNIDYTENELIQGSAAELLTELGWDVRTAGNSETLGDEGLLGRRSYRDILLTRYFREALLRLNPWMTCTQAENAQKTLENCLSTSSLMQVNEEKYIMIKNGIPVSVRQSDGREDTKQAAVIDFNNPKNNYFLAVREMKIKSNLYERRPDIIGFVNGIPLLFMELKNYNVEVSDAYSGNYTDYLDTIPQLFRYNAFVMLSNGEQAKVGTLGSKFEFFHEWKRLNENDEGNVELATMLRGMCKKSTFLDLLENFILYDHEKDGTKKILARNHQYLGVNNAVKAWENRKLNGGKLGVFWHTQGSGKSYSMLFLSQKIRRKYSGSPTIVILTDREELNKQISGTFESCRLLGNVKASRFIAHSSEDLIEKLRGNPSFIFTLIQKFNNPNTEPICPEHDILIISDEAHRSQYGIFAENMTQLLPAASRIGFTGTPLLSSDNITERTFGSYISIYDFKRAVEDGATVPLYYENRAVKIKNLQNPEINDRILDAIERADLDPNQQERLEKNFAREIHILTAEERLDAIAEDFVQHYSDIWTSGKAMFVCLNKVTCVRIYNLVQKHWRRKIETLEAELSETRNPELEDKLRWMLTTEMAVVISQEQNEIQTFKKWGLDIRTHREKMEKRELDKEFKDKSNPLRVVFVCAMWLTGFDVKCLSCLYLDKPLKAHTLMQTIARANRVDEGKSNGLIIDYIGIVNALKKALADYTRIHNGNNPTIDKTELITRIIAIISETETFLKRKSFTLKELTEASTQNQRLELLLSAKNALYSKIKDKKTFQTYAAELIRLMKYANHDEIEAGTRKKYNAILAIYNALKERKSHPCNNDLMKEIHDTINEYINVERDKPSTIIDISSIDFKRLATEFASSKRQNLFMCDIQEVIRTKLEKLLASNPQRIDYYTRYQTIISEYNREQDRATIEKAFEELLKLANELKQEEQRYVREGFNSDDELAVFDMLFQEGMSKADIRKIKAVAVELLMKVKDKIAELDHCWEKEETRAEVENLIRDTLYMNLPEIYSDYAILACRQSIYEYIYTRYGEAA